MEVVDSNDDPRLTKDQRIVRIVAAALFPSFTPSNTSSFRDILSKQQGMGTTRCFDVVRLLTGKKENLPKGLTASDALKQTLSEAVPITLNELERGFQNPDVLEEAVKRTIPDLPQRMQRIDEIFPIENAPEKQSADELTDDQKLMRILAAKHFPEFGLFSVAELQHYLLGQSGISYGKALAMMKVFTGDEPNFPNGNAYHDTLNSQFSYMVQNHFHITRDRSGKSPPEVNEAIRNPDRLIEIAREQIPDFDARLARVNRVLSAGREASSGVPEGSISLRSVEEVLLGALHDPTTVGQVMDQLTEKSQTEHGL